ncbi:MAG: hypothetical protein FJZ58_05330 [Chlamydiae bacterium]|nr:hypothetical protein [Chlamydiota bacterium]
MRKDKKLEELKLLSRLKVMGYILCCFGAAWFFYALTCSLPEPNFPLEEFTFEEGGLSLDTLSSEVTALNFFFVALIFVCIGVLCLVFTRWYINKHSLRK